MIKYKLNLPTEIKILKHTNMGLFIKTNNNIETNISNQEFGNLPEKYNKCLYEITHKLYCEGSDVFQELTNKLMLYHRKNTYVNSLGYITNVEGKYNGTYENGSGTIEVTFNPLTHK